VAVRCLCDARDGVWRCAVPDGDWADELVVH
jgi:hypothetical protein